MKTSFLCHRIGAEFLRPHAKFLLKLSSAFFAVRESNRAPHHSPMSA